MAGELYVDTLKTKRARTVPLVPVVVPIVDRWSVGKAPGEWLFTAPAGDPLRETNWQRSVSWREAKATIGRPELRVHDLRHTAASVWLAPGLIRKWFSEYWGTPQLNEMVDAERAEVDEAIRQMRRTRGDLDSPRIHLIDTARPGAGPSCTPTCQPPLGPDHVQKHGVGQPRIYPSPQLCLGFALDALDLVA